MNKPYPYLKVILGFALLGSALGGLLLAFAPTIVYWHSPWRLEEMLIGFAGGALITVLPALSTGAWLAWWRVSCNRRGLWHVALAGAMFSALGAFAIFAIARLVEGDSWMLPHLLPLLAFMTPTGAVSTLLLGWLLLPIMDMEEMYE